MSFIERLKAAIKEGKFWLLFNALGIGVYISIEAWLLAPRIPKKRSTESIRYVSGRPCSFLFWLFILASI